MTVVSFIGSSTGLFQLKRLGETGVKEYAANIGLLNALALIFIGMSACFL
jgi:hypothetical protein